MSFAGLKRRSMLPYYLLVGLPACLVCLGKIAGKNISKKKIILLFFVLLVALLSCRDIVCGIDLNNYFSFFQEAVRRPFSNEHDFEPGYVALESVVAWLMPDFQFFLFVVALFSVVPIFLLYRKESEIPFLTIVLFLTVAPFSMYFSGLRQICAMAFVVPAFYFTKNKKLLWFALTVVCAIFFHRSAFIMTLLYPVYHLRISRKSLFWILPSCAAVFVFNRPIFTFLLTIIDDRYADRYSVLESTGAYTILILLVLFAVYSFVLPKEAQLEEDVVGLRNLLLLSVVIQCFAPVHSLAMRMNYYYLLFVPILIPKIANRSSAKNRMVAKLSVAVMCSFFAVYFIYKGYTSEDILNIYPYIPFWEG